MTSITLYNIARPLSIGDEGAFSSDSDISSVIRQNFKNLLLTQRGERLFRRSLGSNIRHLLFEQKTEQLKISIAEDVVKTVSSWMNFLILDSINVLYSIDSVPLKFSFLQLPNENEVLVIIEYHFSVSSKTISDVLNLTVSSEQ